MGSPTTPTAHAPAQRQLAKAVARRAAHVSNAAEDWKSLHQLYRRLTRAPAPVTPLFDKTGKYRYAVKDQAEILAKHLEEQFTAHPAPDSSEAALH
ncbi:hypothetical protein EVAR_46799_1 [Eumeta japonica]|uniref:Uncharacterized protein n=1 Tax=Eumeta variegata TaxID=151549 RepID=A0A4C1XCJ6_EUMVA|nr:hypothetical protein EVAR_46799_1 [Eumeta japonica]